MARQTATDSSFASGGVDVDFYSLGNTFGPSYNDFIVRNAADEVVYEEDFGQDPVAAPSNLPPWQPVNGSWAINDGVLTGSGGYGNIQYVPTTSPPSDYSVDGRVRFTPGAYGGGIGGRVDPATGAHYGIWLYPSGSSDPTPNRIKLIKFTDWTTWSGTPLQSTPLTVDANWHDLKVEFVGARIRAWVDGVQVIDFTDPAPLSGSGISFDTYTPGQLDVDSVSMATPAQYSAAGSIISSAFDAGADAEWQTIAWNASTPAGTSVQLRTRTAATAAGLESATWSAPYASSGAPIAEREWPLDPVHGGPRHARIHPSRHRSSTSPLPTRRRNHRRPCRRRQSGSVSSPQPVSGRSIGDVYGHGVSDA